MTNKCYNIQDENKHKLNLRSDGRLSTCFIDKSYVVASIFRTKALKLQENFVTFRECNVISNLLQREYNSKNLNVCIIDGIDSCYYKVTDGIITLNKERNVDLQDIEQRYQSYIPNLDILLTLWDENFIMECLNKLKVV